MKSGTFLFPAACLSFACVPIAAMGQATIQPVPGQGATTKPTPVRPVPVPSPQSGRPETQPPRPQPPRPQPPRPPRPPVVVNPGWSTAVLYSGPRWQGHYLTVRHAIPDLRHYGFDNRAASLRATGRWQLCSRTRYRGHCITVHGNRRALGRVIGEVSSIRFLGR